MPYCPKCDMEFVEGISACSDCGGPLASSKEEAKRMEEEDFFNDGPDDWEDAKAGEEEACREEDGKMPGGHDTQASPSVRIRPKTYVKKSQKYEDMKSSVSAFMLVGVLLGAFSFLCITGLLPIPASGASKLLFEGVLLAMAAGCFIVAFSTSRSAKEIFGQIEEEEQATREIVDWFASSYQREDLDQQLWAEFPGLSQEEYSLKRFELIQDLLITNRDLPDQAYVDALCEEIYQRVFEENQV